LVLKGHSLTLLGTDERERRGNKSVCPNFPLSSSSKGPTAIHVSYDKDQDHILDDEMSAPAEEKKQAAQRGTLTPYFLSGPEGTSGGALKNKNGGRGDK